MKTTDSGLQYEVLTEGKGDHPKATDKVTVNYKGSLLDGTVFDSSYDRGQPVSFPLANVIPGWTEGVQLMTPGSKYKFYLPSTLAYGERGAPPKIGPNSTLVFEVELISVDKTRCGSRCPGHEVEVSFKAAKKARLMPGRALFVCRPEISADSGLPAQAYCDEAERADRRGTATIPASDCGRRRRSGR